MQQFVVPQFIDVENKIIGPITTRQFLIFIIAAMLIFICYKAFDFSLFLTLGLLIFALSGTLAFAKINGRPFHFFLLNLIQTWKRPKLRVWNNKLGSSNYSFEIQQAVHENNVVANKTYYGRSHLAELSLVVDTQGFYRGDDDSQVTDISLINQNK